MLGARSPFGGAFGASTLASTVGQGGVHVLVAGELASCLLSGENSQHGEGRWRVAFMSSPGEKRRGRRVTQDHGDVHRRFRHAER